MSLVFGDTKTISVTDASARGVSGLLRDAEGGNDLIVERHGRAVAAVVGIGRLAEIANLEADIRSAALVLARAADDDGTRSDIDDVIDALGFDRSQLEAELDAEIAGEA
jgi:antitoxin (DNA-binding transcriptional repressor) of toxin-antitoxin stability system